jgi:hypothetical protein
MERTTDAAGRRRLSFSFNRLITNMIPNFSNSATPDSLTVTEIDKIFDFQISMKDPRRLSPASLYIMEIAGDESTSEKVFKKLISIGVLRKEGAEVDTKSISAKFVNEIPWIPTWRQKRLICLLFAWEEELMRWRLLAEEEQEIQVVLKEEKEAGSANIGHLEKRLMELKGLEKVKPSTSEQQQNGVAEEESLPAYEHTA